MVHGAKVRWARTYEARIRGTRVDEAKRRGFTGHWSGGTKKNGRRRRLHYYLKHGKKETKRNLEYLIN